MYQQPPGHGPPGYGPPSHGYPPQGYGHHPPPKKSNTAVWVVLAVLVGVVLLGVLGAMGSKSKKSDKQKKAKRVDLVEMVEAFEDNEVDAEDEYSGKRVKIDGEVTRISKTFGTASIAVSADGTRRGVLCSLDDEKDAKGLSKGDEVTIEGEVDGLLLLNVVVRDCRVR